MAELMEGEALESEPYEVGVAALSGDDADLGDTVAVVESAVTTAIDDLDELADLDI